jgi:glycosyltransferase involved in cell wall biosynthesis
MPMMSNPSYSVLIPALNAQDTISELLKQLREIPVPPAHIFVIDDGSSDNTKQLAEKHQAAVFRFNKNQGKGKALQQGLQLFSKQTEDDFVICMDADLQHSPADIGFFLEKRKQFSDTLIIGSREIKIIQMPFLRFLSNKITSQILSSLTGQKIRDSQCGFRLIPRNILKDNCFKEKGFQFESEFILWCSRQKIPIEFVSIPTIYNRQGSRINHIGDTFKFLKLAVREFFNR